MSFLTMTFQGADWDRDFTKTSDSSSFNTLVCCGTSTQTGPCASAVT